MLTVDGKTKVAPFRNTVVGGKVGWGATPFPTQTIMMTHQLVPAPLPDCAAPRLLLRHSARAPLPLPPPPLARPQKLLFFPTWPFAPGPHSVVLAAKSIFGEGTPSQVAAYTHVVSRGQYSPRSMCRARICRCA